MFSARCLFEDASGRVLYAASALKKTELLPKATNAAFKYDEPNRAGFCILYFTIETCSQNAANSMPILLNDISCKKFNAVILYKNQ
jgi:hypothetical protein